MILSSKARLAGAGLVALSLAGCSVTPVAPNVDTPGMPNAEVALQKSMDETAREMARIGAIEPSAAVAAKPTVVAVSRPGRRPLILDPNVSLFLGKRSRAARPKASGSSHAPSTSVSRPKGGLGQLWRKRTRSLFRSLLRPIIIPVPARKRPVPSARNCGAGSPAYPCNGRMATRFRHDRRGDPPLSGPDSRA